MPEYVRVRDKETGHHVSILQSVYDRNPDGWQELKQDATYADGTPLPPKHKTTVDQKATEKKAGQTAASTEKEN